MWRIPGPLISSQNQVVLTITSDVLIGNLFNFLGSPAGPQDVRITIDGADVGQIEITADWAGGSTFTFICINNGRILGIGGDGGEGGSWTGSSGTRGLSGENGGDALSSDGFAVDIDIDDGFLYGGGGGGGGGGPQRTGSFSGSGGGGGGGGQGYNGGDGGPRGTQFAQQNPPPNPGAPGSRTVNGQGGFGGTPVFTNAGGNGGKWGSGGETGVNGSQYTSFPGALRTEAGVGGRAGAAYAPSNGATINYTGSKDETTLRSEERILGTTSVNIPVYNSSRNQTNAFASQPGSSTTGTTFRSDGRINQGDLSGGGTIFSGEWLKSLSTTEAAKYEIRERNGANDITGTWAQRVNVVPGNWSALSTSRTQAISSSSGIEGATTVMEIRRNDVPGNPNDQIICSFYCTAVDENGV